MSEFKDVTLGQKVVGILTARAAGTGGPPTAIAGTEVKTLYIDGAWSSPIAAANIDGVTLTEAPNSNPSLGVGVVIDTSVNTHGNWARGKHYILAVSGTTVDGVTAADVVIEFGIEYEHEPGRIIVGHTAQAIASLQIQLAANDVPTGTNTLQRAIVKELDSALAQEREIGSSNDSTDLCTIPTDWNPVPGSPPRYNVYAVSPGITALDIVAAHFARAFDATKMAGLTFEELTGLIASVLLGKGSGLNTGLPIFRNLGDTADAVSATSDAPGNRMAVTLTKTAVR